MRYGLVVDADGRVLFSDSRRAPDDVDLLQHAESAAKSMPDFEWTRRPFRALLIDLEHRPKLGAVVEVV